MKVQPANREEWDRYLDAFWRRRWNAHAQARYWACVRRRDGRAFQALRVVSTALGLGSVAVAIGGDTAVLRVAAGVAGTLAAANGVIEFKDFIRRLDQLSMRWKERAGFYDSEYTQLFAEDHTATPHADLDVEDHQIDELAKGMPDRPRWMSKCQDEVVRIHASEFRHEGGNQRQERCMAEHESFMTEVILGESEEPWFPEADDSVEPGPSVPFEM